MTAIPEHARAGDVAIVGMAGRFPGAATLRDFWRNLRAGVESVTHFTDDDLRRAGVDEHTVHHGDSIRAGGVLGDSDRFDATLFAISPAEAELMDPQHRILLECAWSTLDDAGYGARHEAADIGVFAGTSMSSYLLNVLLRNNNSFPVDLDLRTLIGNDKDHLTARIAYRLDLTGPAVTVQSACSTSLVAVHLAAQSVLNGECSMALAGGVSIGSPQVATARYVKGGIVSRDGHLRAFAAEADGIVGGSGAGLVLLKGLTEALADRDHIHAVIRGSAINNDGRAKVGYSAPSQRGQARAVRSALAAADIDPATIGYVEAHGTGTPLGDPIEIAALTQSYAGVTGSCFVGSVKSNIGHLDAAAGIAGLIKAVLCLEHGEIAPSLHVGTPNPELHLETTPFRICSTLTPWPTGASPRRAGVSAFGMGGTNAHVVLEEAPASPVRSTSKPRPELLVLSARHDEALDIMAAELADTLENCTGIELADVTHTLQTGRTALNRRRALVADTTPRMVSALRARRWLGDGDAGQDLPVIFMFAGQGEDLRGAGDLLRLRYPTFGDTVDHCADLLRPLCGFDIRAAMAGTAVGRAEQYDLKDTLVAQPALFVLEYALGRLWMDWGVTPTAMIGHSLGEYTAACLAGVLSLEGALSVVAERGRLMQHAAPGAMLVAALAEQDAAAFLSDTSGHHVELAAVNSPRNCVLSGPPDHITSLAEVLTQQRIPHRLLATRRAFHSSSMDAAAERVGELIAGQHPTAPRIPYITTLTGDWAAATDLTTADHWARHTREPVRFHRGLQALAALGAAGYLELGPGDDLAKLSNASGTRAATVTVSSLTTTGHTQPEDSSLLAAAGQLWSHGTRLDLPATTPHPHPKRVPLPTYPFDHRRAWTGPQPQQHQVSAAATPTTPESWLYAPGWRCVLTASHRPRSPVSPRWSVNIHPTTAEPDGQLFGADPGDGDRSIHVRAGSRFAQDSPRRFTVDLDNPGDYVDLASALSRMERIPLHFQLHPPPAGATTPAAVLTPLLHLARAVALKIPADWPDVRVCCVTTGAQAVGGESVTAPLQALLAGAILAIAHELPWVSCSCIDLPTNPQRSSMLLLATAIRTGTRTGPMAIRGGRLFAPTIEPAPHGSHNEIMPPILRSNGVYLITGGLGGVGGTIAQYLARAARARLVLISRRADRPLSSASQRIVDGIRRAGGSVLIVGADVTRPADIHRAHTLAASRFGPINGIVHAAGIAAAGMLHTDQRAAVQTACAPKVDGTTILNDEFRSTELDFVTLCSSLVSVIGAPAQAAYTAGNAYLDVIPFTDQFPGAVVQTINWDTWREVGMAVDTAMPPELDAQRRHSLANGINPQQGALIFAAALASGQPRIIVATRDPRTSTERYQPAATPARRASDNRPTDQSARPDRPAAPTRNRLAAVEDDLCRLWAQALGMPSISPDDNVFELGADSLVALQVVATIEQHYARQLSPIVCYEAPTARLLARLIVDPADDASALAASEARGRARQRGTVR